MLTGAALATTNRLPALLLPSDTFATRVADPVLQQLEQPWDAGLTVNDAFRPLSRFFDRVQRPEQLYSTALAAMRVLTDPAETGAVTIALPEDVQAEAVDVPLAFLQEREWHIRRPVPERDALARAVAAIRAAERPLIIAGGGVIYSGAEEQLRALVEATGIPVGTTQAGGGSLAWDHPAVPRGDRRDGHDRGEPARRRGRSHHRNRHALQRLHHGVAHRVPASRTSDSSTSMSPPFDAYKHGTPLPVIADARETLAALDRRAERLDGGARRSPSECPARSANGMASWTPRFTPSGLAAAGPVRDHRGRSVASPHRGTSSSRPRGRSPAICTSCGASVIRSDTTSSTPTRAWATRSPEPSE